MFSVQRFSFGKKLGKALTLLFDQTALSKIPYPLFQDPQGYIKKNNVRGFFQVFHTCLAVDGTAACGNDMILTIQGKQNLFLSHTEPL